MAEESSDLTLSLRWQETASELPLAFADHMLVGNRGDYYVFTVGQTVEPTAPPKDPEAFTEAVESGTFGIRPVARFVVPRGKMEEWATVLQRFVLENAGRRKDEADVSD